MSLLLHLGRPLLKIDFIGQSKFSLHFQCCCSYLVLHTFSPPSFFLSELGMIWIKVLGWIFLWGRTLFKTHLSKNHMVKWQSLIIKMVKLIDEHAVISQFRRSLIAIIFDPFLLSLKSISLCYLIHS